MLPLQFLSLALWINHAFALPQFPADRPPAESSIDPDLIQSADVAAEASKEQLVNQATWRGVGYALIPALLAGGFLGSLVGSRKLSFYECVYNKMVKEAQAQDRRLNLAEVREAAAQREKWLLEHLGRWSDECQWWNYGAGRQDMVHELTSLMSRTTGIRVSPRKTRKGKGVPDPGVVANPNANTPGSADDTRSAGAPTTAPDPSANNKGPDKSNAQHINVASFRKAVHDAGGAVHSFLIPIGRALNSVKGHKGVGVPYPNAVNSVPRFPAVL